MDTESQSNTGASNMQQEMSVNMFYTEGSSDKTYQVQLTEKDSGWVVNYQYGRRGSSLKSGTKTPEPVEYAAAHKIYTQLVASKTSDGYTPCESGERYQSTENAGRATGLVPQLLNAVEESEIEDLLRDDAWVAQEKSDGERRMIIIDGETIVGTNRDGLIVPITAQLEAALRSLSLIRQGRTVIDGEDLGDAGFVPFDALELNGADLRNDPYTRRLAVLEGILTSADTFISRTLSASNEADKRELLRTLREKNAEGIVFKRSAAAWNAGRPNSGGTALKFKFVATATVAVAPGRAGKRSVEVRVVDPQGSLVPVGNVTIPANAALPAPGEHIEVRYLYAYPGGSLFQPVFVRARPDKGTPDEIGTLKLKAA